jgi:hypothetical protein
MCASREKPDESLWGGLALLDDAGGRILDDMRTHPRRAFASRSGGSAA